MALRQAILKRLDADHADLDRVLHSADGLLVEKVVTAIFANEPPNHQAEVEWFDECYRVAQHRGAIAGGWLLRFLIAYYVGRRRGYW